MNIENIIKTLEFGRDFMKASAEALDDECASGIASGLGVALKIINPEYIEKDPDQEETFRELFDIIKEQELIATTKEVSNVETLFRNQD